MSGKKGNSRSFMLPALLIRAGIDHVRHSDELKDSNPYSRCEEALRVCQELWEELIGKPDPAILEPAIVTAYWEEFFHAEDPHADEREWREGLTKRSGQYDSFEEWAEWFKGSYAKVYKENNIWTSVLMTSWAHTHQYELTYQGDTWDFKPSKSYLPSSQMWRLEPHLATVSEVLREAWQDEVRHYDEDGFQIHEETIPYYGHAECLGFDMKKYTISWPARAQRPREELSVGDMVADIVVPVGDSWYRHLDNIIFAHDYVDITSLINRAQYVFGSRRRLLKLTADNGWNKAKLQASAEGWLVQDIEDKPEEAVNI